MKRLLAFILAAALCISLFGCGEKKPEYTMEGVLLSHSLEMAELTGVVAENFELMSYNESLMEKAETFTCLADKRPDKAWITDVGNIGTKVSILHGQLLGSEYLACAGALNHTALVQMPWELDDTYGVLLRFREDDTVAYSLVVFDPLEEESTSVSTYAVFSDVAKILIDQYFDDAEIYDDDEIEELCEAAEDVSLTAEPSDEEASEDYYREKALEIMGGVAASRGDPELYTTSPEVLDYCELWKDVAGEKPTDVEVWMLEDPVDYLSTFGQMEEISDRRMKDYLERAMGSAIPMQFTAAYGDAVVAACSVTQRMARGVYLGPAPEDQDGMVLVVLTFGEEATALVCIYDSGYGLNQYSFGFFPGTMEEDPEDGGFERLD